MTDIVDIFLSIDNVERMNRIFRDIPAYKRELDPRTGSRPCGVRPFMHEFIYGPYMAGLYDVWTGTDADLYLRHMNDEFIKYMDIRYQKKAHASCASAHAPSARIEIASYLNPFDSERVEQRRVEMAQSRRPNIRGTGASMGGAKGTRQVLSTPALRCSCGSGVNGAHAVSCGIRAQTRVPEFRAGAHVDELYSRWNRDQACGVHLMSRDDEGSDVGHLDYTRRYANVSACAEPPFDFSESRPWLRDPVAMSGDAQYHLLVLDSQMSVLNEERTIPYGYGTTEDQLREDARVASRYAYRDQFGIVDSGVIPKTSYKKITQVIDPMGRVTLDDDRKLATDIMSRDSKGFIMMGRH